MSILEKSETLRAFVSLLYPPSCAGCAIPVEPGEYLCRSCDESALRIVPPFCDKCSEPFAGAISGSFNCANCANRTLDFVSAVSRYRSRGIVRKLLLDFKYRQHFHLRHPIASWLAENLNDARLRDRHFDGLIPVPLHPARQRERGFNQALLLAELLAKSSGIVVLDALERIRYTTTQTAYDRAERIENLRDAFRLRKKSSVRGLRLLLIDDVLTTGSTLSECARVLKMAGAASVHAATAARA